MAYTPDAPTLAVVDLTLSFILLSIRNVVKHHENMRKNIWIRFAGKRLPYLNIGIVGLGRIGSRVAKALIKLGAKKYFIMI